MDQIMQHEKRENRGENFGRKVKKKKKLRKNPKLNTYVIAQDPIIAQGGFFPKNNKRTVSNKDAQGQGGFFPKNNTQVHKSRYFSIWSWREDLKESDN